MDGRAYFEKSCGVRKKSENETHSRIPPITVVERSRRLEAQRITEPIAVESGIAHAPTAPGLGIGISEKEAANIPSAPEVTMPYFHRDGSVADW